MARRNNRRTTRRNTRRPTRKGKRTTSIQKKFQLSKPRAATVKSLSAIVETKKFKGWDGTTSIGIVTSYLSVTSPYKLLVPYSFMNMQSTRDLAGLFSSVEGRSIFSKYLQMKLEFTYPFGTAAPPVPSEPVEVIYGFCEPSNLTDFTTIPEDTVSRQDLIDLVVQQTQAEFDSADDKMGFKERKRRAYNIVGRFKIKPSKDSQIPSSIGLGLASYSVAPIQRSVNWKTMKKLRMNRSTDARSTDPSVPFLYPNQAYVPFVIMYNKSYENYTANIDPTDPEKPITQIKLRHNDCHWFNDL